MVNTTAMAAFLDLPREIRDMIYDYCLVVSDAIDPHPIPHERRRTTPRTSRPEVALLRVNRMVGAEATEALYGQNIVRLSTTTQNNAWFIYTARDDALECPYEWHPKAQLVRKFVTSFDFRHVDPDEIASLNRSLRKPPQDRRVLTASLHNERMWFLNYILDLRLGMLAKLPKRPAVEIDFRDSFCLNGCCRLIFPREWSVLIARFSSFTAVGLGDIHEDVCLIKAIQQEAGCDFNIEIADSKQDWAPLDRSVTELWTRKVAAKQSSTVLRLENWDISTINERFAKGEYGWVVNTIPYADGCCWECSKVCGRKWTSES